MTAGVQITLIICATVLILAFVPSKHDQFISRDRKTRQKLILTLTDANKDASNGVFFI